MTHRDEINIEYFTWLFDIVCKYTYPREMSYKKLLQHLHNIEFKPLMERDENRLEDGLSMRYKFSCENAYVDDAEYYLDGPCSVLELMVALAIRIEEVMDDPTIGDRTGQWFWSMVTSLGLGSMTDTRFDREYVNEAIVRFMNRNYESNGAGGLFTIRNCDQDVRKVEIWIQACWYMDTIA